MSAKNCLTAKFERVSGYVKFTHALIVVEETERIVRFCKYVLRPLAFTTDAWRLSSTIEADLLVRIIGLLK